MIYVHAGLGCIEIDSKGLGFLFNIKLTSKCQLGAICKRSIKLNGLVS